MSLELKNKQRAYLSGLAAKMQPIFQVGKSDVTPEIVNAIDEALEKRELIKVSVLKNCMDTPANVAQTLSGRTKSTVVRVIGRKIVLYRPAKKPVIELPE